ncbi:hypothetical protein KO498_02725 [Lentibacter algarum]|uniref:hypothetical protein n=1 Tax=Lentibacter algarum TaxID=576131 RepID=UPI001C0691A4|nr:hypothetical protein [Lentibacter algarum]MBU2980719.1 hypothetical protein [Lentibacter algarum]
MTRSTAFAISLCALLPLSLPAWAEDDGLTLMERGAQLFLEGILKEVEPAIDDLQELAEGMEPALKEFADNMGPALADLFDQIEDWSAYEPPEILPNGDIILRKKTPDELRPNDDAIEL